MTAASGTWERPMLAVVAPVVIAQGDAQRVGLTGHARPPPGVSNTLLAIAVLGCLLAVLLIIRGEQILARLVTGWT